MSLTVTVEVPPRDHEVLAWRRLAVRAEHGPLCLDSLRTTSTMESEAMNGESAVEKTIGGLVLIVGIGLIIWLAMRLISGPENCDPPHYCPPGSGSVYHPEDHPEPEWHPIIR